ncbi:hypothetical protein QAD02_001440 [Eretmocerus hayati]|uniref:Uncharacterized protein n=1 Tax=Eretmocerus hayati TaxID=131215 RepID=A0ACC2NHT2_9HYME|nr:hypothetical protein QAD02_001440 [Eretmocerus hayati]
MFKPKEYRRMRCLAHNGRWSKTSALKSARSIASTSTTNTKVRSRVIGRLGDESDNKCYICARSDGSLYHVVPLNGQSVERSVDEKFNCKSSLGLDRDEFWERLSSNHGASFPIFSLVDTEKPHEASSLAEIFNKLKELDTNKLKYKRSSPEDFLRDNIFSDANGRIVFVNQHMLVGSKTPTYNSIVFAKKLLKALYPSIDQKFISCDVPEWARRLFADIKKRLFVKSTSGVARRR